MARRGSCEAQVSHVSATPAPAPAVVQDDTCWTLPAQFSFSPPRASVKQVSSEVAGNDAIWALPTQLTYPSSWDAPAASKPKTKPTRRASAPAAPAPAPAPASELTLEEDDVSDDGDDDGSVEKNEEMGSMDWAALLDYIDAQHKNLSAKERLLVRHAGDADSGSKIRSKKTKAKQQKGETGLRQLCSRLSVRVSSKHLSLKSMTFKKWSHRICVLQQRRDWHEDGLELVMHDSWLDVERGDAGMGGSSPKLVLPLCGHGAFDGYTTSIKAKTYHIQKGGVKGGIKNVIYTCKLVSRSENVKEIKFGHPDLLVMQLFVAGLDIALGNKTVAHANRPKLKVMQKQPQKQAQKQAQSRSRANSVETHKKCHSDSFARLPGNWGDVAVVSTGKLDHHLNVAPVSKEMSFDDFVANKTAPKQKQPGVRKHKGGRSSSSAQHNEMNLIDLDWSDIKVQQFTDSKPQQQSMNTQQYQPQQHWP